jgi:PAS domain S-box-containing protein
VPVAVYEKVHNDIIVHQRMQAEQHRNQAALKDMLNESEQSRRALLGVLEDQERAEEAVKESEVRYRSVLEQSADGIFLEDIKTRTVMEANPAFCQMLGYAPEEIKGLSLYDIVDADRADIDSRFSRVLRSEPFVHERKYRRKDGSLVDVWLSPTIISYAGKQAICTLVRDLTEKKALEAQVLRAQRMETIGLLAGGIAHDLNNILSPILMNTELLQREAASASQQKLLSSISASAQRGADIVRRILTFSRGMEGERSLLSPSPLLKEMDRLLQETFPKNIRIQTDLPKDLYPVWGDATQLHQVLMNLCLNAKDAMEKGGKLSLSAQNLTLDEAYAKMYPEAQVGPYLLLTISDTGSGIPPEHLEKIFDPFFTTKERGKGTGLGLATVLALVKGHGGFLSVKSEVGKGTSFRIFLPASPAAEGEAAPVEREALPLGSGQFLLVVEDEESIRDILKTTLETYGYSVLSASDGAEAVSLYAEHIGEISLVITDMAMPIMDGPATIRALQRMSPSLPIIAISGADWEEKAAEGTGLKIEAFLSKPFTSERMLRRVAEVLKKA